MRDLHTRLGGLQGECGQISADYTHKGRAENYQKSQWDVTLNKEARKQSEITMSCELRRRNSNKRLPWQWPQERARPASALIDCMKRRVQPLPESTGHGMLEVVLVRSRLDKPPCSDTAPFRLPPSWH